MEKKDLIIKSYITLCYFMLYYVFSVYNLPTWNASVNEILSNSYAYSSLYSTVHTANTCQRGEKTNRRHSTQSPGGSACKKTKHWRLPKCSSKHAVLFSIRSCSLIHCNVDYTSPAGKALIFGLLEEIPPRCFHRVHPRSSLQLLSYSSVEACYSHYANIMQP